MFNAMMEKRKQKFYYYFSFLFWDLGHITSRIVKLVLTFQQYNLQNIQTTNKPNINKKYAIIFCGWMLI